MFQYVRSKSEVVAQRVLQSPRAEWLLGVVSFLESSLLPIVIDPLLALLVLAQPKRWLRLSLVASGTSVLGGIAGYAIGALFFNIIGAQIIVLYGLEDAFAHTAALFDNNAFLVVLFGAFTPIPYKIFALTGGVLGVNLLVFIFASLVGRVARFIIVGYIVKQFGTQLLSRYSRHLNIITIAVVLLVLIYAVITIL